MFLNLVSLALPRLSRFCWSSWPCTPKLDSVLLLPDLRRSLLPESLDLLSETPNTGSVASRAASETNCVNLAIEGYLPLASKVLTTYFLHRPCRDCGSLSTILTILLRVSISSSLFMAFKVSLQLLRSSASS